MSGESLLGQTESEGEKANHLRGWGAKPTGLTESAGLLSRTSEPVVAQSGRGFFA
jgi:hypothetical protein